MSDLQEYYDVRIPHPTTMLVVGPSSSGKTIFTKTLIHNKDLIFKPNPPGYTILIYEEWQESYNELKQKGLVNLTVKGMPEFAYLKEIFSENSSQTGTLLILDDQMNNINPEIVKIFTIFSHHLNVTCIMLSQSLFLNNKEFRTISLNSKYIVLMKNTRDPSSITQLAKQTNPFNTRYVLDSYRDATIQPYSYLVIDLRQECIEKLRFRANIFDPEKIFVYLPK